MSYENAELLKRLLRMLQHVYTSKAPSHTMMDFVHQVNHQYSYFLCLFLGRRSGLHLHTFLRLCSRKEWIQMSPLVH